MKNEAWTIAKVKSELPTVKVKVGKRHMWARVTGRLNQFATVTPYALADNRYKLVKPIYGACYSFAWDTIVNALNNGRVLDCN